MKFLVVDIDGVLTDGGMYYSDSGDEYKKFNTKDGMALKRLASSGKIKTGILSSGFNPKIGETRAAILGLDYVYVGQEPKLKVLKEWCSELGLKLKNVAYIGDDINDLEVMKSVGLSACPADAVMQIKDITDVILMRNGGDACVREFVDDYLPYY